MSDVVVLIGPGSIGQAIARRVSAGKQVLLAGLHQENANAAAERGIEQCGIRREHRHR
jgi:predicted dinucleotide-binding enzyme